MERGRPKKSIVRDNVAKILSILKTAYAYELAKYYKQIFGKTTTRNIYYQLQKGIDLGIFEIDRIEKEIGEYTWGSVAEKVYYKLSIELPESKRVQNFMNKSGS